jgi:hypothetical protein
MTRPGESQAAASLADRPLEVFSTCRARDLPVLEMAARRLPRMIPFLRLNVVAPDADCARMERRLGGAVRVIPEEGFIPGMTLRRLRQLQAPGFPGMAGWYFQQFLKLQCAFVDPEDDYYLIWDADTVPLRPMRLFNGGDRMLLTMADEDHKPYFETYRRLFAEDPRREFSFIAQHMIVQKSVAREMLAEVERNIPGGESWAWKIMAALPADLGPHVFSEYETYGHFIKNRHPERVQFIRRAWLREPTFQHGRPAPTEQELRDLAKNYDYAAFERVSPAWRRLAKWLRNRLRPQP